MLNGKTILITGGTGSFGHKCTETILSRYQPRKLIIFSRDEFKQYEMSQKFPTGPSSPMRYFIGDVRDKERLQRAFQSVDYVIHAAALKQVPAAEYNPTEFIKTNIHGAQNVVNVAADRGVKKVVALSTDKAANPINLYGATKLCSDKLFVAANAFVGLDEARFSVVRYGNVLGSRGSVVPLFLKQKATGAVSVTDPRMTRFWITLEQGVDFVLKCLEHMRGGEIFVPKLPSMNIMDLAAALCPECEVKIIGIRPGEKIHEVMVPLADARRTIEFKRNYVILPDDADILTRFEDSPGQPVSEDFEYSSGDNPWQLSVDELKGLLGMA
ncbi:UDP-N-acetylglucosamine 4,6-dehydratase (inverting) [Solidesulfovibrio sp.]|uniref:UDP-N-acetylglucosamine 4,6-dehydratase (inverting) n=1 Tax=Solidesulfovibrio sp. TaxID=2910990 RepID=UPI002B221063|nr:UDP-N-acetylglucosamine 4,6-dehydratase (inverting) [Solidesulfovibrio sp.]MEA5090913.1 UDP-N-acetylglucosamine 4,6-dehydratase (inverting) [Solidesulfovibrio sp.]